MNIIVAGILSYNILGIWSGVIISIAHGLISVSLFYIVGLVINRNMVREDNSIKYLPISIKVILFILLFSNLSFPGTISFVGEIGILISIS